MQVFRFPSGLLLQLLECGTLITTIKPITTPMKTNSKMFRGKNQGHFFDPIMNTPTPRVCFRCAI
jgi:hypothetical protein